MIFSNACNSTKPRPTVYWHIQPTQVLLTHGDHDIHDYSPVTSSRQRWKISLQCRDEGPCVTITNCAFARFSLPLCCALEHWGHDSRTGRRGRSRPAKFSPGCMKLIPANINTLLAPISAGNLFALRLPVLTMTARLYYLNQHCRF